jgi:folylpolyglutamate synthase
VPKKVGLCISPHLIAVRERIRINSSPLSEKDFARYFFEVWDRLETAGVSHEGQAVEKASAAEHVEDLSAGQGHMNTSDLPRGNREPAPGSKPIYARFLTLLSFHVFLREEVDVAIYEVGLGGEYDATNIIPHPVATGISTLGIDHVFSLGNTIEQIAWHKAGIMKPGAEAFSVEQVPEAEGVLRERAREKGVGLKVLGVDERLSGVAIRPDAMFQKRNASLAVALAESLLAKVDPNFVENEKRLPTEFVDGLEQVVWRGRCEVIRDGRITWHIDGAHTIDSLKVAGRWFAGETEGKPGPRVLIFNQQGRPEAIDFLQGLYESTRTKDGTAVQHVIFCTNKTYAATGYSKDFVDHQSDGAAVKKLTVQQAFAQKWTEMDLTAEVSTAASIEEAINRVRQMAASPSLKNGEAVQAFITGSIHLIGGAMGILTGADAL